MPDEVLAALRCDPSGFAEELRLTASIAWYEQGRISQEVAARLAGLDRTDFLLALAQRGKDSFKVNFDDLDRELDRG